MCRQISDMVHVEGVEYWRIGSDPEVLFDPREHGIVPQFRSTGCYRGFASSYRISGGVLHLHELGVNSEDECYPRINGTTAEERQPDRFQESPVERACGRVYRFSEFRLRFTGTIRVGRGHTDIDLGRSRMGYADEKEYLTVIDLDLDHGVMVAKRDLSRRVARIREQQAYLNRLRKEDLLDDPWMKDLRDNSGSPGAMWVDTSRILLEPDPDGLGRKIGELERDLRTPRHFVAIMGRIHRRAVECAERYKEPRPDFVEIELCQLLTLQELAVKRVPPHLLEWLGKLVANGAPEKALLAYFLSMVGTTVAVESWERLRSDLERIAEEGALVDCVRFAVREMLEGATPELWFGSCGGSDACISR